MRLTCVCVLLAFVLGCAQRGADESARTDSGFQSAWQNAKFLVVDVFDDLESPKKRRLYASLMTGRASEIPTRRYIICDPDLIASTGRTIRDMSEEKIDGKMSFYPAVVLQITIVPLRDRKDSRSVGHTILMTRMGVFVHRQNQLVAYDLDILGNAGSRLFELLAEMEPSKTKGVYDISGETNE